MQSISKRVLFAHAIKRLHESNEINEQVPILQIRASRRASTDAQKHQCSPFFRGSRE